MAELALGALAAVVASALFSAGLLLQALEARRVPPEAAQGVSLVLRLLRRPRWLLGAGAMVVGFGFHVTALLFAPLTVVQPSLAAGLLVLLVYAARVDGTPVGARELAGVVAIGGGVVALTVTSPERTTVTASAAALVIGLGALALVAVAPQAAPRRADWFGLLATLAAGCAYSLTGLTTKLLSNRLDAEDWAGGAGWLAATVIAAVLALLDQTAALQRRGATQVGVVIYVMPVIVPVVLSPLVLGEGWGSAPEGPVPLALALLVVAAGAAALAGSRGVSAAEHPSSA
jgi:drug/metabolite transporter (DMT)-like permease